LALIVLLALGLRLHGIGFGLPSLNDPDEPLFMMTAFEMLKHRTLNPSWFGHPATTTFYALALVLLGVAGFSIGSGRYAGIKAFGDAAYADPGIAFLPARMLMAAFGVACVWLVHRIGRRLGGEKLGLIAALLLAVNAIHIEYSQIIRTDVQASLFMLLGALSALAIVRDGRRRDYVLAGVFAGLACATKWPAALILANALGAGLWRWRQDGGQGTRDLRLLALTAVAAVVTLLAVSPYLLLDWPAVVRNLAGEARPIHPGATGGGFLFNLAWYLDHTLIASFGLVGTVLAGLGLITLVRAAPRDAAALLPTPLVLLAVICGQSLLWERWIVPLLPFAALLAAHALVTLANGLRMRIGSRRERGGAMPWLEPLALLVLIVPMVRAELVRGHERAHDTRQIAAAWVRDHVPAGSTILVEHAAFDLLQGPWTLRFPLGAMGCVDPRAALSGQIGYSKVETARHGSPLVDVGHVDRERLETCRTDYAVFSNYGRYRDRPGPFAAELER